MAKKKKYYYNKKMVNEMKLTTMQKIYRELKPIAKKRIERLKKAGYGDYDIVDLKLPPIKGTDIKKLGEALVETSRFLRDPRSMVSKLKQIEKKTRETLAEHEYYPKNIRQFARVFEYAKELISDIIYDSDRVAILYEEMERHNISSKMINENFAYLYNNLETLKSTIPIENDGQKVTASAVIAKMKRDKWEAAGAAYIEDHDYLGSAAYARARHAQDKINKKKRKNKKG